MERNLFWFEDEKSLRIHKKLLSDIRAVDPSIDWVDSSYKNDSCASISYYFKKLGNGDDVWVELFAFTSVDEAHRELGETAHQFCVLGHLYNEPTMSWEGNDRNAAILQAIMQVKMIMINVKEDK